MNLFRRHIGRRVAAVGVGVALVVLGLEAPAFAVLGLTSFTPASGPTNCVVVITGADFQGPDVTSVAFGAGNTAAFAIQSDTELWAAVPATAPTTGAFITLTKSATGETVSSSTPFTRTTGAGSCAPTITSFAPTCGPVGTTVTITGTNLIQASGTPTAFSGAQVEFSPFGGTGGAVGITATHTGAAETPTSVTVLVPTGAKTGPISVTTAGGEVFSTTDFTVPVAPATCVAPPGVTHARSITLKLKDALVAKGKVSSTEDPAVTECVATVPVKIQRKVSGHWKTIAKTTTSDTGAYSRKIKNKKGKYRSIAVKTTLASGEVCLKAKSPVRTH